jgi:hypothetical protein
MIDQALRTLAESFSVSRDEWRKMNRGGDMLLDGLVAHGYAQSESGQYAITPAGQRRLSDRVPVEEVCGGD